MVWITEFSEQAERDFELIFDHLVEPYVEFGDEVGDAIAKAAERVEGIRSAAGDLANAPFRGTRRDAIAPGLRTVTVDRAIFWFDLDEGEQKVRILAVVYGGQDHIRHMLVRLLEDDQGP